MPAVADDVCSFRLTLAIRTAIFAVGFRLTSATGMRALIFRFLIRHDFHRFLLDRPILLPKGRVPTKTNLARQRPNLIPIRHTDGRKAAQ